MVYSFSVLFILFIIYSFIGWLLEVVGKLIEKGKIINRGFLMGPYCPIYGIGCVLMILLLTKYIEDPFTLFIMCILIFSILEYSTSFFMEKIFKIRWWDYTRYKFNINGRVCLETMIPFGLGGVLIMYVINPMFLKMIKMLPEDIIAIISMMLLVLFIIDLSISTKVILSLKTTVKNIKKDATEEITTKVRELILSNSRYFGKRLFKAFPRLKIK